MPDNVDLQNATVTINKGRGAFYFKISANDVYIAFEDKGGGGDVYDVTVRFPVPPDTSVSQAAEKFPQGRFRVRYNNRNCMMVRINATSTTFSSDSAEGQ